MESANLLQQLHHADLGPMPRNFAILQPVDVNLGPADSLVGRRGPIIMPLCVATAELLSTTFSPEAMRSSSVTTISGKALFIMIPNDPDLSQPFETGGHRHAEVVNELRVEEMDDTIDVVFVLKIRVNSLMTCLFLSSCIGPPRGDWISADVDVVRRDIAPADGAPLAGSSPQRIQLGTRRRFADA